MCLADYQKVIVDQIYNLLINDDCNRGITLCGDAGSGKSTIALGVVAQLQEGWSVFILKESTPVFLHILHGILVLNYIPIKN